jgi:hypothetical protein
MLLKLSFPKIQVMATAPSRFEWLRGRVAEACSRIEPGWKIGGHWTLVSRYNADRARHEPHGEAVTAPYDTEIPVPSWRIPVLAKQGTIFAR